MKLLPCFLAAAFLALPIRAHAIEFITEAQVQSHLKADKVIEVSKYNVKALLKEDDTDCEHAILSKSGRAYVVKKGDASALYLTPSGLAGLNQCAEL